MKSFFYRFAIFLIIGIITFFTCSCEQSFVTQNENPGRSEEIVKPYERITIDDGSEVCFYSEDENDFALSIKSKSSDTINALLSMSPAEIYEKYKDEKAPEELLERVEKSGFKPESADFNIITPKEPASKAYYYDMIVFFNRYFGEVIDESVFYHTKSHTYKAKVKSPVYLVALVNVCSGSVKYKMRRRVIRAFKSNYWTTISGPETLNEDETLVIKATYGKSREITSDVYDVDGVFHHIAGTRYYAE
ncbi:MAG: hypothetical protein JXJ04_26320 [Spirochaetales bacterium]|nr:hypothetical protein [Spirochaetales bacterium]